MLQQITAREEKVQKVLQRLGCCDSTGYKQLYTTWLLQRAVADPERVAGYVVHPRAQRLKFWSEVSLAGQYKGARSALSLILTQWYKASWLSFDRKPALLAACLFMCVSPFQDLCEHCAAQESARCTMR